jgi:SNF2 family DNA or RNA helicase
MTGTPIRKNQIDIFGQFKVLNEEVFGTRFETFKQEYGWWGGYMDKKLLKPRNVKRLRRKMKPWIFQATKEECLDLPDRTHEIIPVYLDESREAYDEMARESILKLKSGEVVEAKIVLTQLLRLAQITGGWIGSKDQARRIGREKVIQLYRMLKDFREQERKKLVVFARFRPTLRDIAWAANKTGYERILFHGGVPRGGERERRILKFHESEKPTMFICQVKTGAESIDLTCASEAFMYDPPDDMGDFWQALDRLHRIGQVNKVTYYHFLARHSIDEINYMANQAKINLAKFVMRHPELLMGQEL